MELHARWPWSLHPGPWIAWAALFATLTIDPFRWHLDYFRNPGPQFYRAVLWALPLLTAACFGYCRLRAERVRRLEFPALATAVLAPALLFEPRGLLVVLCILAAAVAAGDEALHRLKVETRSGFERTLLAAGAGLGLLMLALLPLGVAGLFSWPVFIALLGAPILIWRKRLAEAAAALWGSMREWPRDAGCGSGLTGIAVFFSAIFLTLTTALVLAPSVAHDSVMMHLAAVRRYASDGSLAPLPFQPFSLYPQGAETLMTVAYVLGGQPAVQFVNPLFLALTVGGVAAIGRRLEMNRSACFFASAVSLSTPFVLWGGSIIKNDLPVAAFLLLGLCCALDAEGEQGKGRLRLGVFLLASSLAVKQTAIFGAPCVGLLLLYRLRRRRGALREAALWALICAVVAGGWPARAYAYTGNPIFPETLLRTAQRVSPAVGGSQAWKGVPYLKIPWYVTFDGARSFESPTPNPLGFFLLLSAPALFLLERRRSNPRIVALAAVACGFYLLWGALFPFLRYAIALIGLAYILAAERFEAAYELAGAPLRAVIGGGALYNFLLCLLPTMIISINGPQLELFSGRIDREEYLRRALAPYGAMEHLQRSAGACDLIMGAWVTTAGYAPDPTSFHPLFPAANGLAVIREELAKRPYRFLVAPDTAEGRAAGEASPPGYRSTLAYEDGRFVVYRLRPPEKALPESDCVENRDYDTLR